jgi:hypothetical protein
MGLEKRFHEETNFRAALGGGDADWRGVRLG